MQKILNIISVISFLLVAGITGGGVFGYLWITNEDNQKMLQDKAMEKVMDSMKMPDLSALFFLLQNLLSFDRDSQNRS